MHAVIRLGQAAAETRFALRQLRRHRGFSLAAIVVLTLGLAVAVAIFGFVDAALVKPLPYAGSSRLVTAFGVAPERLQGQRRGNVSYLDLAEWRQHVRAFASIAGYDVRSGFLLTAAEARQRVPGLRVTAGFFRTLGVTPILGRDFRPEEEGPSAAATVVLSYSAWQARFGARTDIVGQTVSLQGEPHTIIGVLPRGFLFPMAEHGEFWTTIRGRQPCWELRGCRSIEMIARLRDGASLAVASADATSAVERVRREYPDTHREAQVAKVVPLREAMLGDVRSTLLVLAAATALLLLIGCMNVVSLLLARSDSRATEIAVRSALGASFRRLLWQFSAEAAVLVALAGGASLLIASWLMRVLRGLLTEDQLSRMPFFGDVAVNARVVFTTVIVCLAAGFVFALVPAWRGLPSAKRAGLRDARASTGTMWRQFGRHLVMAELAVAIVLLVNAGLVGKSVYRLLHVETGFSADGLITVPVRSGAVPPPASGAIPAAALSFARSVADRVAALPGVQSVGSADVVPLAPAMAPSSTLWVAGRPEQDQRTEDWPVRRISAGYLHTLEARFVAGRSFTEAEVGSLAPVIIINDTAAARYFPGEDPIGRTIALGGSASLARQIVGIVADLADGPPDAPPHPAAYIPLDQSDFNLVIRTSLSQQALVPMLASAIRDLKRDAAVGTATTMTDRLTSLPSTSLRRLSAWLIAMFAAVAFALSIAGLYGVVSYGMRRRKREIGVRMALGARRIAVYRLMFAEVGAVVAPATILGLVAAVGAAQTARGLLFDVPSWDPAVLAASALALASSAFLATYAAARGATSVSPVEALRPE